jgi:diguanylate cyclase (GGDEF)-like protein
MPSHFSDDTIGFAVLQTAMDARRSADEVSTLWLRNVNNSLHMVRIVSRLLDYSIRDPMTGLLNRRGFMERSPRHLELARQEGQCFVMLSADMDHMKKINDEYGHLMGDQAICRMGKAVERLQALGMTPVHISGDEFLAFGIRATRAEAERVLSEAREAVRQLNEEEPWMEETSASFGLYTAVPGEGDTIDLFLTRADRAMYEDKTRHRS